MMATLIFGGKKKKMEGTATKLKQQQIFLLLIIHLFCGISTVKETWEAIKSIPQIEVGKEANHLSHLFWLVVINLGASQLLFH